MIRVGAAAIWLFAAAALTGGAAQAPDGNAARGKTLVQQRCGLCHTAGPGDGEGGQGPPLGQVVGRKAGSFAGFHYSAALRDAGLVWTPDALDRFLTAPAKALPGTAMPMSVPGSKDRADIIAYLAQLR